VFLFSALSLALAAPSFAQTAAKAPPAAPAAAVAPHAVDAKIALIAFEQAVFATNEGQKTVAEVQAKYAPQKAKIDTQNSEVESLKKQVQALPANTTDEERANRLKVIDTKEKNLSRDAEDATQAYNADLQEAMSKVAQKFASTAKEYAASHGYTLLLDVGAQSSNVLYAAPGTEISQAVVEDYNRTSGVAAPVPSAPSATPRARPATTGPKK
jgi:Skp family chaperone for outer membrane proteins